MKHLAALFAFICICTLPIKAETQDMTGRNEGKPTVYMVSNAHFDTQWKWTVQQSINEFLHNTLVQNFALIEQYPDYVFNFEGAVKYRWAKEYYPELFEQLKKYVKAGRWHISGASWDANDPNIPSIEASIRNILLGQEFYRKEFGVLSTDIMLPDCFGFGWQLPSVAAHCGLIGFGTQKLAWRKQPFFANGMKFPFYFGLWRGPDGGRLMAALDGGDYVWNPDKPITDNADLKKRLAATAVPAAYRYFGTGDKGGSATPVAVRVINDAVQHPGEGYNLKFATTDDMFKDYLWDKRLPEYDGELLMDVHATGNYTSIVEMKMLNRRNELMLGAAEGISSVVDYFKGINYPSYTIDEGWKRIIWHQFHDDLTGTSLPACYRFSYNDEYINLRQMNSVIETGMASVASIMNTNAKGCPTVVYNHVSAVNGDIVTAEVRLPAGYGDAEVYSPDGRRVKSQIIARDGDKAIIIFSGKNPSLSLSVYDIRPVKKVAHTTSSLKASGRHIENRIYSITLNEDGDIASIIDKRCGRELVRKGEAFGYAFFPGNKSVDWPAWEILKTTMDRTHEIVGGGAVVTVEECGPLRAILKVEREYAGSKFIQRIVLTDGAEDNRIDVVNTVDWQSRAALLKASFPVAFDAPEATYDLGMAQIRRGNNTDTAYEVIAQQWADITAPDGSYGVTIVNNGRYGWDKPDDHTIRLTLFHTPETAGRYPYQATQDFGKHDFTYSIIGHAGALDPVNADIASDKLNQPQISLATAKHSGKLGKVFSLASSTNPALRIKAFKKAQDGNGYILRVYELSGRGAVGKIDFGCEIVAAERVNGIEDRIGTLDADNGSAGELSFSGRSLDIEAGKYALSTFRIHFAEAATKIAGFTYKMMDLPFNTVAITTDSFTSQGMLGKTGDSFAAEILPEDFEYRGIPFNFGEPDFKDAVRCNGQKIALPEGTKTVHLLVASDAVKCAGNGDTEPLIVRFKAGDKTFDRSIAHYTGFYGVYGWPDYYGSHLRTEDVAYVGTHTHNINERNKAYVFTYMYLISIPVDGCSELDLPNERNALIFSATAEQ